MFDLPYREEVRNRIPQLRHSVLIHDTVRALAPMPPLKALALIQAYRANRPGLFFKDLDRVRALVPDPAMLVPAPHTFQHRHQSA